MKRRIVSTLLIGTMLASCFIGCGASTQTSTRTVSESEDVVTSEVSELVQVDNKTETITLALRAGTYSEVIKACVAEYEKNNHVNCEILELEEDDLHSRIMEDAINEEGTYDLCMVDGSWMAEFTESDVLANLSEMGYVLDDDIIEATTEICYSNGDAYLVPYYGNVTVLMYNKANIEAAGYKAEELDSLEDILKVCVYAKNNGKKGYVYRGDTENNTVVDFLPILLSCGGWVVDENNQPTVNTEEFKRAMNTYLNLIASGDAEAKNDLIASIDTGLATAAIGWPGWYVPTEYSKAGYIGLSGKETDDSEAYKCNVYGIWTIGITANSAHKDATLDLLEYLMDKDVQLLTVENGGVPCRYSCLTNEDLLAVHPEYEVVCKALDNGKYRPVIAEWPDFYTILGTEMGNIISGTKSVDLGLEDAQSQLEELMNKSEGTDAE